MKKQTISVIIPAHNREKTIKYCISSVLKQSLLPDEIIVVDDASNDKTKEIVLAHLSEEANTKEKALETYRKIFNQNNLEFDNIKVASQIDVVSGGNYED